MRFGGAAGEDVAVGTATGEQPLSEQAQPGLDLGRRRRVEHADRLACFPVAEAKARHAQGTP